MAVPEDPNLPSRFPLQLYLPSLPSSLVRCFNTSFCPSKLVGWYMHQHDHLNRPLLVRAVILFRSVAVSAWLCEAARDDNLVLVTLVKFGFSALSVPRFLGDLVLDLVLKLQIVLRVVV